MSPTSLIFVVLLGVWAAYFAQYWIRRREHLATMHSVDALSETMRVLGRREPLSTEEDRSHGSRVLASASPRPVHQVRQVHQVRAQVPGQRRAAEGAAVEADVDRHQPERPQRVDAPWAMRPSRGARGLAFLLSACGTVVFALLGVVGVLRGWAFLVPLAMTVASVMWLRAGVRYEQRTRRELRRRARRTRETQARDAQGAGAEQVAYAASAPLAERVSLAGHEPVAASMGETVAEAEVAAEVESDGVTAAAAGGARSVVADGAGRPLSEPEFEPVADPSGPELDEDDMPLTWDPRPVPRPTYTMKARAADRTPVEFTEPAPEVEAVSEGDAAAYDDVSQRRIAGA